MKIRIFSLMVALSVVSGSYAMQTAYFWQREFVHAAGGGCLAQVEQSLRAGADIDEYCRCCRMTALISSVFRGKNEVVNFLLQQGAKIEKANVQNRTVLHAAADNGHLDLLKLLLERGAQLNAQDNNGYSALMFAVTSSEFVTESVLAPGVTLLEPGCTSGSESQEKLEILRHLLVAGCDHTTKSNDNKTAYDCAKDDKAREMLADPNKYMQEHPEEFEEARQWHREWQIQIFKNKHRQTKTNIFTLLAKREVGCFDDEPKSTRANEQKDAGSALQKGFLLKGNKKNPRSEKKNSRNNKQQEDTGLKKGFLLQDAKKNSDDKKKNERKKKKKNGLKKGFLL